MKCNSCGNITKINCGDDFTILCETCSNNNSENDFLDVSDTNESETKKFIDPDGVSIFSFEGRINRTSFLFTLIPLFIVSFFVRIGVIVYGIPILGVIFFIPAIWIAIATYVKRWHDLGKSGWMALLLFIPFLNILVFIYLCVWPGKTESNEYGDEII